jgi:phage tail sheath protein FI
VLSVPLHYRESAATEYVAALAAHFDDADNSPHALSYASLFHPWTIVRETTGDASASVWPIAPDGGICGCIALRTLRSGAWFSVGNQPLEGVVSLDPWPTDDALKALLEGRVNPIALRQRGFLALASQTLSDDPDFVELHVRRLLILLRRLALREGTVMVFENNDDALRRLAERHFGSVLSDMYARGAFVGATADQAFRVVAGAGPIKADSDAGRLIVELRVAPARPLSFLTVRLLQTGGELLAAQEA